MKRRGQVWIETVLYTLIGLALIGIALGFMMPKINQARDKAMVEQAINSLGVIDEKIGEVVQKGVNNRRETEFSMKEGELYINATGDEIMFVITGLAKPVSEPDVDVPIGRIIQRSVVEQKTSTVYLRIRYNSNITYKGVDETKKFTASSVPYSFIVQNSGYQNGRVLVDIEEISNR